MKSNEPQGWLKAALDEGEDSDTEVLVSEEASVEEDSEDETEEPVDH